MKHVILVGIVVLFVSCICVYDSHMNVYVGGERAQK
jgi:hypothetical protein